MAGAKFVLEPRVAALCTGAGFVTLRLVWRKLAFLPFAWVVVNQGDSSCALDFFADHRAAIGGIHQFIARIDPLRADAHER